MASVKPLTRLIYCVDGTYCTPDGPQPRGRGNISNVYRICASVKTGEFYDDVAQKEIRQEKIYEGGVGSADGIGQFEKLRAGVLGDGYKPMIRKVYQQCCKLGPEDEVWLYGFSRGAYIVRAVAGLLHYIGALQSAGGSDFKEEYSRALGFYETPEKRSKAGPGQASPLLAMQNCACRLPPYELHNFQTFKVRQPPQIRFVGVFDTVKALQDELHDISFNDSVQHFRHALALNEDRKSMTPEYVFPSYGGTHAKLSKRSFVQAWFVGAHLDMGGSAKNDGLALYPLQWMLIESKTKGLVLEFSQPPQVKVKIDDPLRVIFPKDEKDGPGCGVHDFTTSNMVNVGMHDLRNVHELAEYNDRYSIKINKRRELYWVKQPREPFSDGKLRGYCNFASQGTIIHPSVYQFLDQFIVSNLGQDALPDKENIEKWRSKMLGEKHSIVNQGFWSDRLPVEVDDLKSIRILVCGNTGVGKSTLINKVFGIKRVDDEVTRTSDRKRGLHDVREEIKYSERPDLILHDSGGFEAGDQTQLQAVGNFVKEKSSRTRIEDRLHVIWFCIEMGNVRIQQTATQSLFKAVAEYAAEVPIIVVLTKTDQFRGMMRQEGEDKLENANEDIDEGELHRGGKEYAVVRIDETMRLIEKEIQEVDGGHFDACVDIARNDPKSIQRLNDVTLQNVNNERLRMLYIAAQTADVDLKVNCAIIETMKIYKRVLATSATLGAIPSAPSSNRVASAISVCKAVVQCFGLPTVNYNTIFQLVKTNVWDDLSHNVSIAFAECIATVGILGSIAFCGMPVFLASGAVNIPLVVPATARLMLMLASDLILILVRAFRESTDKCVYQPMIKDLEKATRFYRQIAPRVHAEVLQLVPKRNMLKSFKYGDVQQGLAKAVHKYKEEVSKDVNPGSTARRSVSSTNSESTTLVKTEMAEMEKDLSAAKTEIRDRFDSQETLVNR